MRQRQSRRECAFDRDPAGTRPARALPLRNATGLGDQNARVLPGGAGPVALVSRSVRGVPDLGERTRMRSGCGCCSRGVGATSARSRAACSRSRATTSSGSIRRCTRAAISGRRLLPRRSAWTSATSQEEHLDGFEAVVHLAALSNDPIGELDERADVRDQPRGDRPAGRARTGPRRRALRVRVVLQHVRRVGIGPPDRRDARRSHH